MSREPRQKPSERFLREGLPTRRDRFAIDALRRRRQYLEHQLEGPVYPGSSYDDREETALAWVLALVDRICEIGGLDGNRDLPRDS